MLTALLIIAAGFLALSNGANDNFKGVASLYGCGLASYRQAIAWATLTTAAGSATSFFLAGALLQRFTGKGLVPDTLIGSETFVMAVAGGAALTVMLASRLGFPVSTTHGLLGALGGAGAAATGPGSVNLSGLANGFALPLVLGPILAIGLGGLVFLVFRLARGQLRSMDSPCVCLDIETAPVLAPAGGGALSEAPGRSSLVIETGTSEQCIAAGYGRAGRIDGGRLAGALHWASAGAVSFARGLNDTPKIAALLLVTHSIAPAWDVAIVAMAMAAGGLAGARRVAETMSCRITSLDPQEGLAANLATAALVLSASVFALPVSTTHVSVGSLFGIALTTGEANHRTMIGIILSWLITVPVAALLAASSYLLARAFFT